MSTFSTRDDATADRGTESKQALGRTWDGAVEENAGGANLAVVRKTAGRRDGVRAGVFHHAQDPHVELGPSVVSLLTGLGDAVRDKARIVGTERSDHAAVFQFFRG